MNDTKPQASEGNGDAVYDFSSDFSISPVKPGTPTAPVAETPSTTQTPAQTSAQNPAQKFINVFDMPETPTMEKLLTDRDRQLRASLRQGESAQAPKAVASAPIQARPNPPVQPQSIQPKPPVQPNQTIQPAPAAQPVQPSQVQPPQPAKSAEFPTKAPLTVIATGEAVVPVIELKNAAPGPHIVPNEKQKPIRTFEADVAEAIKTKHLSSSSLIIQEKNKLEKEKRERAEKERKEQEALKKANEADRVRKEQEEREAQLMREADERSRQQAMEAAARNQADKAVEDQIAAINARDEAIQNREKAAAEEAQTLEAEIAANIPKEDMTPLSAAVQSPKATPVQQTATPPPPAPAVSINRDYSREVMPSPLSERELAHDIAEKPIRHHRLMSKLFLAMVSMIFILGGIIGAYVLYEKSALAPSAISNQKIQNIPNGLINTDLKVFINIDGLSQNQIVTALKTEFAKPQNANSIREIVLTSQADAGGKPAMPNVLGRVGIHPPDILTRTLGDTWVIGVYSDASSQKTAFAIVTHNFFQNAFAGMLAWEPTMPNDIRDFLYSGNSENFSIRGRFVDGIVKNKDVREFQSSTGNILFLYSFIDNNKIVIAGNEGTLGEIIDRIEKQGYMR